MIIINHLCLADSLELTPPSLPSSLPTPPHLWLDGQPGRDQLLLWRLGGLPAGRHSRRGDDLGKTHITQRCFFFLSKNKQINKWELNPPIIIKKC